MNVVIFASIFVIPFVQSEETVDEFLKRSIPHGRNRRFVNGQEYQSVEDTADYLVRITRANPATKTVHTVCSGSIISENLVLTSGGCLHEDWSNYSKKKRLIPIWQLEVIAGEFNTTQTETTEQKRTPIQMYLHPQIKATDHRRMWTNDIAIIQVDRDFTFNDQVNKVDLWLSRFGLNDSYLDYYSLIKVSGFGDSGSHNTQQYSNLFDTFYPYNQTTPQYQYLAYVARRDGPCLARFTSSNDVEAGMYTLRPNAVNPYIPKPLLTAKRCFYTSSLDLAGYIPTSGDYGGPMTWRSVDNNQEYQVFLTPWQPESKASFEDDQNYMYWGELLTYYKDFIGNVFEAAAETSKDKHYPQLDATSDWQTLSDEMSLQYFSNYQYYVRLATETGKFLQVNITLTGENSANAMRNSVVYIRDSGNKSVLAHFLGKNATLTDTVEVTKSSTGSIGDKWGCTLKSGVPDYTTPPTLPPSESTNFVTTRQTTRMRTTTAGVIITTTAAATTQTTTIQNAPPFFGGRRKKRNSEKKLRREKRDELTDDIYTCEDAEVNTAPGTPHTASTFVISTYWDTISYKSNNDKDLELEFQINKPLHSADQGTITLTVDYRYIDVEDGKDGSGSDIKADDADDATDAESVEDVKDDNNRCDAGYRMCDDKLSCIDPDAVCDFDPDCLDTHDESFWCLDRQCLSSEYLCYTGECINLRHICDGTCDCLDKTVCEDETLLCTKSPLDKEKVFLLGAGNIADPDQSAETNKRRKVKKHSSSEASDALGYFINGFLLSAFLTIHFLLRG